MENNLHLEVLPKRQKLLFNVLCGLDWISDFYLAGGTALALQIAHRRSIDFDFFTEKEFDVPSVKKLLLKLGEYTVFSESSQIIDGQLNSVRMSFFNLPYKLIDKEIRCGNLRIISRKDIAAMKLSAISTRGSRKDFIDLYFLLKEFPLEQMIGFFEKKYGKNEENVYCALKALAYFIDAEQKPMPAMLKQVNWREIKKEILLKHKQYLEALNN